MTRGALLAAVLLLWGCAQVPQPTDAELGAVMVQVLRDQGGELIYHQGLGDKRRARPTSLLAVAADGCLAIARRAYWCRLRIDYATARENRKSAVIELRVEYRDGRWWGKPDD